MKHPNHADRIASMNCLVCGRRAELHHIISGNEYGRFPKDDRYIAPLCTKHHRDNRHGIHGALVVDNPTPFRLTANQRFKIKYGIDLYQWSRDQWEESKKKAPEGA